MFFLIQQEAGSLRRRPRLMQISELPRWIVKDDAEVNIKSKLETGCVLMTEKKIWVDLGVRTFEFLFCFCYNFCDVQVIREFETSVLVWFASPPLPSTFAFKEADQNALGMHCGWTLCFDLIYPMVHFARTWQ